jgi:Flp pilus assembly protein TadG
VELALLLPLLVTLCAFIAEFGRVYWTQNVLQKAAQEGARALSLAPPTQLGQRMPGIATQLLQDIRSGGIVNVQNANIALVCLDAAFNPFAAPPAYCVPGSSVAVDGTLGYVQTSITLPLTNLGSWMPFYFPLPGAAGYTLINADSGYRITLNATALYRYASN